MLTECFRYRERTLYCDEVALADIASAAGTPCYVYSAQAILGRLGAYREAFGPTPHCICYSVKANGNLAVLRLLAEAGSGFDIVSGGELYRVLKAGGNPAKVVFSGVGKTREEIDYALEEGIHSFNSESEAELALIDSLAARRGTRARVALRVNPDIDAGTHPYIATGLREHKFGIGMAEAVEVYRRAGKLGNVSLEGVSCHIGSQLLDAGPMLEAAEKMLELVDHLRDAGLGIRFLDLGGGLGVAYQTTEEAPAIAEFVAGIRSRLGGRELTLLVEPGRSLVGAAGVLLTRVLYRKRSGEKKFIIVDAAMNDLLRPALYRAHHEILPLREGAGSIVADVVGPVCESADFLARDREMANVMPGDYLAVCTAGAYGFVLASNYNARPRPAEVLVEGSGWTMARRRESWEDLVRGEA